MNDIKSLFKEEINKIKFTNLGEERNYWVVRAGVDSDCYDEFLRGSYIAVGIKEINSIEMIKENNHKQLKKYIEKFYPDKKSPGNSASMLKNFVEYIKEGDIVITPSAGKETVSFGKVIGTPFIDADETLNNHQEGIEGDFLNKKRKVEWLKTLNKSDVEPKLLLALSSPNAVFSLNENVRDLVDFHFSKFYKDGDKATITFEITKEENLGIDLIKFQANILKILELYQEINNEDLNLDEITVKIRAQSKGRISITGVAKTIGILGFLGVILCGGKAKFKENEIEIKTDGLATRFIEAYTEKNNQEIKLKELDIKLAELELEKIKLKIQDPIIEK